MKIILDIVKRIVIVVISIFVGGYINMFLITISSKIIPPPIGANLTTEEGLKAAMPLMEPKHFIMPFLAHALGTFIAALLITIGMQIVFIVTQM